MLKKLSFFLIFVTILTLPLFFKDTGFKVHAQENQAASTAVSRDHFYTALTSTYTVDTTGNTRVEHHFRIRNNTPEYFINSYNLRLGTEAISEINITSGDQQITPKVTQAGGATQIEIEFPDKVLGKDKIRQFKVSYLNPVMSEVNGQVLETFIPAMGSAKNYDEHRVVLITPLQFGHPSRIKPDNFEIKQDGQTFVLTYKNLSNEGVSAIFGSRQVFRMSIRYHLDNPHSQPAITQVSLPPDTPFQKMHYHVLEPQPQEMITDADGNWIATYYLPANNTVEVNIELSALVSLEEIHPWLNPIPIPEHTNKQTFWEIDHREIQEIAQRYQTPKEIYKFVVENLEYTQEDLTQQLERLGALKTLRTPTLATCQEFTDLFIALARANQIPARRATGYAHSNDPVLQPLSLVTDILHAWPEYYQIEEERWIPVDPTWGNTMKGVDYFHQFDLKHVVFAYNGRSSRLPLAAGNYKLPNQESKDLKVGFDQDFPEEELHASLAIKPRKLFGFVRLPSWYELEIENQTGQAWYHNQLQIETLLESSQDADRDLIVQPSQKEIVLLPWQRQILPIQVYNEGRWLPQDKQIKVSLQQGETKITKAFSIKTIRQPAPQLTQLISETINYEQPIQLHQLLKQTRVQTILVVITATVAVAAGSLLVFRRRKKSSLRR